MLIVPDVCVDVIIVIINTKDTVSHVPSSCSCEYSSSWSELQEEEWVEEIERGCGDGGDGGRGAEEGDS